MAHYGTTGGGPQPVFFAAEGADPWARDPCLISIPSPSKARMEQVR
jgi:hypothetical protein